MIFSHLWHLKRLSRIFHTNSYILPTHNICKKEQIKICAPLKVNSRTRISQNQAKSNYKDCSFEKRDSSVKGTRLSVLILAKSQACRQFEVLEVATLESIYIFIDK